MSQTYLDFSYRVESKYLLQHVKIPFIDGDRIGGFCLITGVENLSLGLLGGILGGLFPVKKEESFPQIEELVKYFMGTLEIHEGSLPSSGSYVGPDPERHLLFSRVYEEIYAQIGSDISEEEVLSRFLLSPDFLDRRISTLSGGEKVRLILSIVFSKDSQCVVLHGVMPWLDTYGKMALLKEIQRALDEKRSIVVIEQEIKPFIKFRSSKSSFLYFDGMRTHPYIESYQQSVVKKLKDLSSNIGIILSELNSSKEIMRFNGVYFGYENKADISSMLLKGLSFTIKTSGIYGLVGDNGTGKSTIAKLMLRIEKPFRGTIQLMGEKLEQLQRKELIQRISFVGQFPERQLTFSTVAQYIQFSEKNGRSFSKNLMKDYFKENEGMPIASLTPIDLKILLLSSTVDMETRLIILDEPTWGIDYDGQYRLLEIIYSIVKKNPDISILLISHNKDFLDQFSAKIMYLHEGHLTYT